MTSYVMYFIRGGIHNGKQMYGVANSGSASARPKHSFLYVLQTLRSEWEQSSGRHGVRPAAQ